MMSDWKLNGVEKMVMAAIRENAAKIAEKQAEEAASRQALADAREQLAAIDAAYTALRERLSAFEAGDMSIGDSELIELYSREKIAGVRQAALRKTVKEIEDLHAQDAARLSFTVTHSRHLVTQAFENEVETARRALVEYVNQELR